MPTEWADTFGRGWVGSWTGQLARVSAEDEAQASLALQVRVCVFPSQVTPSGSDYELNGRKDFFLPSDTN